MFYGKNEISHKMQREKEDLIVYFVEHKICDQRSIKIIYRNLHKIINIDKLESE